jgi:hypothetical protein
MSIVCSAGGADTGARSTPGLSQCRSQGHKKSHFEPTPEACSPIDLESRQQDKSETVRCRGLASACARQMKHAPECFKVRVRLKRTMYDLQPQERTLEGLQDTLGEGSEMRLERMESQRIQA